jgi:hypothetical protein
MLVQDVVPAFHSAIYPLVNLRKVRMNSQPVRDLRWIAERSMTIRQLLTDWSLPGLAWPGA